MSFQRRAWPAWTADAVALLGLLIYLIQSVIFAHTTISNLDEGAYLLKGTLFVGGGYRPFDPGIWTNKAPLAFLIPGFVQWIFGPGLRTGRYLASFFGVMAVVGTWVAARRLGGKWLAAGAVFVLAFSPLVIKMYSNGATQSTIAALLAWSLALSLGQKRPTWQLALAGLLAGMMLLVRQNMMPVLPLLALYALWENGRKGLWLLIPGVLVVAIVHLMYWPDILQIWNWLPLITIPAEVRVSYGSEGAATWAPQIDYSSRFLSVFQAFRFHFVVLAGNIVALLLWPRMVKWKSRSDFRVALALLLLFSGLLYMHFTAAIRQDYCVFCFTPYIAFFNIAGLLLLVLLARSWNWQPSMINQLVLIALFIVLFAGIGFSAFEDIGTSVLQLPAPRTRDLRILPGFVTWQDVLMNHFELNINLAKKYASGLFGLITGALVSLVIYLWWRRRRHSLRFPSLGAYYASVVLIFGLFLSPILNASTGQPDCAMDVIRANEEIGNHLKGIIPDNSVVYWDGGLSVAPLLYLPNVRIFPAQINGSYSFIKGGDAAQLNRFGLWNEEMAAEWKASASFFIIEEERYPGWKAFFNPDQFVEFAPTATGTSCVEGSRLRIFRRNP